MAVLRETTPYGAFNFLVALGGDQGTGDEGQIVGGFSDVSGLGIEVSYSEYRNGNERVNTARKVPNTHKLDDVTLKRGLVGSLDMFAWLKGVRDGVADPRDSHDHAARRGAQLRRHVAAAPTPSRRSGSARRSPRRAAARWRWRSSTSCTKGSSTAEHAARRGDSDRRPGRLCRGDQADTRAARRAHGRLRVRRGRATRACVGSVFR